jgi:hypothetical protein
MTDDTRWDHALKVTSDGEGLAGQAGAVLLACACPCKRVDATPISSGTATTAATRLATLCTRTGCPSSSRPSSAQRSSP